MNRISMGAINVDTNQREIPRFANKDNRYKCPECEKPVHLKKGEIRIAHFAHNKSDNPCNFYNNPGESEVHKEGKLVMKSLLDNKIQMKFYRKCRECCGQINFTISKTNYNDDTRAVLEHSFKYNDSRKCADVAMLKGDKLKTIFEICYTHKTNECNRPSNIEWYEIDARNLIDKANNIQENKNLVIKCLRNTQCDRCQNPLKYYKMVCDIIKYSEIPNTKFDGTTFIGIRDTYKRTGCFTPKQKLAISNVYTKWNISQRLYDYFGLDSDDEDDIEEEEHKPLYSEKATSKVCREFLFSQIII